MMENLRRTRTEPVMNDSDINGRKDRWFRRHVVATLTAALAIAFGIASLLAEDRSAPAGGAVALALFALLAFIGGRTNRFHMLRDDLDERERALDHRALAVSYGVVGLILVALFVRDLINSEVGGLPMWLLTISGLTYGSTLLYYRWRG